MQKTILTQVILLITSTASSSVFAAAFYNDFQSASAMGNAFVGSGVAGDDISMMFYNPATIALFDEQQFVVAGFYEGTHGEFTVNTATDTFGAPKLDAPGQQYDVLPHQFSGAIYTAMPIDEYFTLGASLTSPYDGYSDYSNSAVENTARQTLLRTYTGNLSLAMEVTEELSLAAGANLQYLQVKMNAALGATKTGIIVYNGFTEYQGDDIAFYPSFGAIYEFSEQTRMGLSYIMNVDQETHGTFESEVSIVIPQNNIDLSETIYVPGSSDFHFPDIVSLDFFHQFNEKVELLADVMFTRWNVVENTVVQTTQPLSEGGTTTPVDVPLDFRNTWTFGVGANYYLLKNLKLRTGVAFDQSPVTDDTRILQVPDADQVDVAIGLMYQPSGWDDLHFDISYMHTFFQDGTVSQKNPIVNAFPDLIEPGAPIISATGSFYTYANFVAAQVVYGY